MNSNESLKFQDKLGNKIHLALKEKLKKKGKNKKSMKQKEETGTKTVKERYREGMSDYPSLVSIH